MQRVKVMSENWKKESDYLLSLTILENLLHHELITTSEFFKCKQVLIDEMKPPLADLFIENSVP